MLAETPVTLYIGTKKYTFLAEDWGDNNQEILNQIGAISYDWGLDTI